MSAEFVILQKLKKGLPVNRVVVPVRASGTITAPFKGYVNIRAMAAGGAGNGSGGNAGDVAILWHHTVHKGDAIVVTNGAGGTYPGGTGNTTTITGPGGLNCSLPGGTGGTAGGTKPAANADPTGFTDFWKGGRGGIRTDAGYPGGGSAPLLWGTLSGFDGGDSTSINGAGGGAGVGGRGGDHVVNSGLSAGGGSGGAAVGNARGKNLDLVDSSDAAKFDYDHSRMLVNVSGGGAVQTGAAAGPGGGGAAQSAGAGYGGGGSGFYANAGAPGLGGGSGGGSSQSGGGSDVVLEFVETL